MRNRLRKPKPKDKNFDHLFLRLREGSGGSYVVKRRARATGKRPPDLITAAGDEMSAANRMDELLRGLQPLSGKLAAHPMYGHLRTLVDLRVFMSYHVYAVWDFMALLKALQRHLTSVEPRWSPAGSARTRRLINEMVLEEESDEIDGVATSHFELYRAAMAEAGADTRPIDAFLARLGEGADLAAAMSACGAPAGARAFVGATFATIASGQPHAIAAAFALGREGAIPKMFGAIVQALRGSGGSLDLFSLYLERHIALDGAEHGEKSLAMLAELCGEDSRKWEEAEASGAGALAARIELWDRVDRALPSVAREAKRAPA